MLEQLIADILNLEKRGAYSEWYGNIDVNALSEELAEKFLDKHINEIENFVDDHLMRY